MVSRSRLCTDAYRVSQRTVSLIRFSSIFRTLGKRERRDILAHVQTYKVSELFAHITYGVDYHLRQQNGRQKQHILADKPGAFKVNSVYAC